MNALVANFLVEKIKYVSFADKYTGIVRPVTIDKATYPVGCGTTVSECEDKYMDYTPNDSKTSVMYFEDRGTRFVNFGENCAYAEMQGSLRLVVWLNGCEIGNEGCDLSARAMLEVLKVLAECPNGSNYDILKSISIEAVSEEPKSDRIFSNYTYSEKVPYLFYPHDYFALNVSVRYRVPIPCITPLNLLPEPCC